MRARYIYSACIVIETDDVTICCDPWFTPGAYDGSWYQYPPLDRDPVDVIGPVDLVYVSHIHPDNYDARFLRRYLDVHPAARIVIGDTTPPYLERKMRIDGLPSEVVQSTTFGGTEITVIPNRAYEEVDAVDTALVVRANGQSVVNMNDNPIDPAQVAAVLDACGGPPTIAFLPYSGAGPYPQTYAFDDAAAQRCAADRKRDQFLDVYSSYISELRPERAVPFAGQYVLGGPLAELNGLRGVPDAVDAAAREPDVSIVLADGGEAFVDAATLEASAVRTERYRETDVDRYIQSIPFEGYDYEREIQPLGDRDLPILPLLAAAYAKAIARTRATEPFWFCVSSRPGTFWCFDTSSDSGVVVSRDVSDLQPRCEIVIDERYLFGLLTRLYHWNNAEIGSHYRSRRVPDIYVREAYSFLHFLQV